MVPVRIIRHRSLEVFGWTLEEADQITCIGTAGPKGVCGTTISLGNVCRVVADVHFGVSKRRLTAIK